MNIYKYKNGNYELKNLDINKYELEDINNIGDLEFYKNYFGDGFVGYFEENGALAVIIDSNVFARENLPVVR